MGIIGGLVKSALDFDEVSVQLVDGRVEYKIVTTLMTPNLIGLKTRLWGYLSPPMGRLEVTDVETVERGLIANRYLVTVQGGVRKIP